MRVTEQAFINGFYGSGRCKKCGKSLDDDFKETCHNCGVDYCAKCAEKLDKCLECEAELHED